MIFDANSMEEHFKNDRDVYYLIFHEMLRVAGYGARDNNYELAQTLYPFPIFNQQEELKDWATAVLDEEKRSQEKTNLSDFEWEEIRERAARKTDERLSVNEYSHRLNEINQLLMNNAIDTNEALRRIEAIHQSFMSTSLIKSAPSENNHFTAYSLLFDLARPADANSNAGLWKSV